MKSDKVEIVDFSGEKFNKISIPCSICLLFIGLLSSLNIYLMFLFPGTLIGVGASLIIVFIFGLYYSYILTRNPGIRKFLICNEKIEILIPKTPLFLIYWSEFNKLEIKLRKFNYKPFHIYELHFVQQNSDRTFKLSLLEFPKQKINQILRLLKEYAKRMGKQFNALKETNISGVVLVENLKI